MVSNYTIIPGARRSGKTSSIATSVAVDEANGLHVAVVVPHEVLEKHMENYHLRNITAADVWTERSFQNARGFVYDKIYVDEANAFHDNPIELCMKVAPGVPAIFTYTPYPFES